MDEGFDALCVYRDSRDITVTWGSIIAVFERRIENFDERNGAILTCDWCGVMYSGPRKPGRSSEVLTE
jgi:hypothetical protein